MLSEYDAKAGKSNQSMQEVPRIKSTWREEHVRSYYTSSSSIVPSPLIQVGKVVEC